MSFNSASFVFSLYNNYCKQECFVMNWYKLQLGKRLECELLMTMDHYSYDNL